MNGFNPTLERLHQTDKDWLYGSASLPCIALIPEAEREKYLPLGEAQNIGGEKMSCASYSPTNLLDTKFYYLVINKLLNDENRVWLEANNYFDETGRVKFSPRFISILSGTTAQGNSLISPLEAIRKYGLIPNSLFPQSSTGSLDDYLNRNAITQEMLDLGKEFTYRFVINYERIDSVLSWDDVDLLDVGAFAWPSSINGIYPRSEAPANHAFMVWKPQYFAFDSYPESPDDFIKQLAPDYEFAAAYRVFISKQNTKEEADIARQVDKTLSLNGLQRFFMSFYNFFFHA